MDAGEPDMQDSGQPSGSAGPNCAVGNMFLSPHYARIVSTFVENARQLASPRPSTTDTSGAAVSAISSLAADLSRDFAMSSTRLPQSQPKKKKKTPGRPASHVRLKLTCLESPSVTTIQRLNTRKLGKLGFGHNKKEETKSGRLGRQFALTLTADQFMAAIRQQFPALGSAEVKLFTAKSGKKLLPLVGLTPAEIKAELGSKTTGNGATVYIRSVLKLSNVSDAILYRGAKDPEEDSIANNVSCPHSTDRTGSEASTVTNSTASFSQEMSEHNEPVCSDCGRTKVANSCLNCIQNMEYEASLATDQRKMKDCERDEDFKKICHEHVVFLMGIGCQEAAVVVGLSQRRGLMKNITTYFLYYRVKPALDQFIQGLQSIGGLFDLMMKNPEGFCSVMCGEKESLTRQKLRALLSISFSKDKTRKKDEGTAIYLFEVFLKKCEDESDDAVSLSQILQFMSGASAIPPLGLPNIVVNFFDVEPGEKRYPSANTCVPIMWLPRWKKLKDTNFRTPFFALLKEGILSSKGFDKM
ncbi:uncharacterized protein LOC135503037 [Lineus longissimus]|uniref:uncharacterized protein LOC135503037 n=2 Tax=Lineus longissimus TaxID=88925 RepID=UPI00315D5B97